jgi:Domain of unknown function (DUF4340)
MSARSRNLWTLLGAAVVALGLGLYAYFGVMKGEQRETERKSAAEKLVTPTSQPDGGPGTIRYDKLVVRAKGDTTELQRLPDQTWIITKPLHAGAEVRAAEEVVSALQNARLKSTVEEKPNPEDLKRYGLERPPVEVTASAQGVPTLTVKAGVENTFDNSSYLQRGSDPKIYAVDGWTRQQLDKSTFDLRDKEVLSVRDLGLTRIELKSKKHGWTVGRDPGQPFAFLRPNKEEADTVAVSGWVAALKNERATRFLVDSPAERKRTGVETPDVEVTFQRGTTETVRVRLAAGKKDADPVYALREDGSGVVLAEVPRSAVAALDKSPADLRDRTVLRVKPEDVARIRVVPEGGGTPLVVDRDRPADGGLESWRVTSPTQVPADNFKLGSFLYALTSLKAEATDEKLPTDPAKTGLGPKARSVSLEGTDGKTLGSFALGKVSPKPAGLFVRDDRGRVAVVEASRVKDIPSRPQDVQPAPPPSPLAPVGGDAGS